MRRVVLAWLAIAGTWGVGAVVEAHGLAPILVRVHESAHGRVQVRWTLSAQGSGLGVASDGTPLTLALPERCVPRAPARGNLDARFQRSTSDFDCAEGLAGAELTLRALRKSDQAVVLRYHGPDGVEHVRTLSGTDDRFTVPALGAEALSGMRSLVRYVALGIEHILGGWDHLAFVICLGLRAARLRALLWPVTAFTLAHSLTLALATLGLVRVPSAPVEACIALSVVWMASEAVRARRRGTTPRSLSAYTFAFGLLHGLGFAGALSDVGFSGVAFAWALAGFNLGVELGQLAVLGGLFALRAGLSRVRGFASAEPWVHAGLLEGAGVLGGYWLAERTLSFL